METSGYDTSVREELRDARAEHVRRLQEAGRSLYPTWHGRTHSTAAVKHNARALITSREPVTVAGRLLSRRTHGGSTFADLHDAAGKLQALFRRDELGPEAYEPLDALDRGDILAVTGTVLETKAGELTVAAAAWTLLAKSLAPLPDTWAGLQDVETRARQRELDLLMNAETRGVFAVRSLVLEVLRDLLRREGFVEVETPVLQSLPGGASARPFVTRHNALDMDVYLRVSPELFLKRLVVGGYERVFEVARNFRNEGVDRQHNPEFTMCELYMAYATVDDLVPLTERLLGEVFLATRGGTRFSYQGKEIDFTPPWRQVRFVETLRDHTGIDVLHETDAQPYVACMKKNGITPPAVQTLPALVDELYREIVRKSVWDPVIVRDFPTYMEPLAKRHDDNPALVQRVQVLAAGMELVKAYTELNDPRDQEERFREQERLRAGGDHSAQRLDTTFLDALRIGLPPTAGWGLGIDRLVMLAADRQHIRDVMLFPLFRTITEDTPRR